ncbi:Ldh family oxidoreductase [Micromonospora sp. R77]|uniref:Ldh family oxidoreductase n=1 Tax=Micromonospora sp. R77 TaxID=2925836 RepID=UPI001F61F3E3|nr:Ldh family oxidoreductase [Micromonospora sp. R77]MCI4066807.1 Ldh family oxidoreductase [Micromonospora sp. R77]
MERIRISVRDLRALCLDTLAEVGVRGEVAEAVADHLVDAEATGHASHGVLQLPSLLRDVRGGRLDPTAEALVEPVDGQLRVDGRGALPHWFLPRLVDRAVVQARRDGAALALIRNLPSTGRLGAYVERAARQGMAALLVTGSLGDPGDALVAAFNGRQRMLGTNPIAFAAPTGGAPLVVDLSTAATTMGQVRLARVTGSDLGGPTVVDAEGRPSCSPAAFYAGGAITPAAEHKGYALGLMVAALGALAGGHDRDGRLAGSLLMVVRPSSAQFPTDLAAALSLVRDSGTGVRVPGADHDDARRRAREDGVPVPAAVLREIDQARQEARRGD